MHATRVLAGPVPSHLSTAPGTHRRRASRAVNGVWPRGRCAPQCQLSCSRLARQRVCRASVAGRGARGTHAGTRRSSTASTSRQLRRTSSSRASSSRSAPSHPPRATALAHLCESAELHVCDCAHLLGRVLCSARLHSCQRLRGPWATNRLARTGPGQLASSMMYSSMSRQYIISMIRAHDSFEIRPFLSRRTSSTGSS